MQSAVQLKAVLLLVVLCKPHVAIRVVAVSARIARVAHQCHLLVSDEACGGESAAHAVVGAV